MAHGVALRPDLQHLLDKYMEICDKFFTSRASNEEQQQRQLASQCEQLAKMKGRMRSVIYWSIKREEWHSACLDCLERKNELLQRALEDAQRERERIQLSNGARVSKLQDQMSLLRTQMVQLENKHREELTSQDRRHKDEISKYENLLENANSSSMRNIAGKGKLTNVKKHPAFITGEKVKNRKRLPGLEVVKVTRKRKKLYQEDETTIDIV